MAPQVPVSIRSCDDLPIAPRMPYKQREVAIYITALKAVARNCKGNLGAVDQVLVDFEAAVAKAKVQK